ncbi:MAG TPA: SGNH/GDSL hydrolase family protein [Terriglobales bacterium]|nr:SGNH/GDSL hydrolase family protein [Terriglobales bacterium]
MALMRNDLRMGKEFWRNGVLVAVTLVGLAALARAADVVYTIPRVRFVAMMLEVLRSRAVLDNPGVTGYYERLFAASPTRTRNNGLLIYDHSFRIVRNKPNLDQQRDGMTTNSFGLIGRQCSQRKPANTRRVALLGDSIAQGWGVQLNQSFGALLEDRLNTAHTNNFQRFEVLNFAVAGYELTQILDVAEEEAPRFEPDVYMLALTELAVFRNWDTHLVNLIQMGIDPKYDFLKKTVRRAGASRDDERVTLFGKLAPFRIPVLRETLAEIKFHAEHDHIPLLVVLVPAVEDGELTRERFAGIRELLASLDITVIDLLDTFEGIPDLDSVRFRGMHPANVHPNSRGHALIFENLHAKLQDQPEAWSALVGGAPEAVKQAEVLTTQESH